MSDSRKPTPDKREQLASNLEWNAWGKLDPLYGVATVPERAKGGGKPWDDYSFYQIGAADWRLFGAKWRQYGLTPGVCVEIGCGAGRMSVHLAKEFQTVHGVDVSPGMIEYARTKVPDNVILHLTEGTQIPLPDDSADAIFSTHVLQHLSSEAAAAGYFREMTRILRPGGTMMVHVPIIAWPWGSLLGLHRLLHRAKRALDGSQAQLRRHAFRRGLIDKPPMQVSWFEVSWLYHTLRRCGLLDVEIRILFGGSTMAVQHPFVFARRKDIATGSRND